jgi:Asp-tRNA(Asn)/Glu-tRNA(Gln) amidotransferase C subunit
VQLAAILSPEQYDEFALRYAPAAQQLREQMRGMNLAPAQFSDLFNALNSITGQPVYYYAGNDPQLLKQQQQLQAQTEAVIKETLGAQTYAAYQLNQDPLYRSAQAVAQQLQVPTSSVMPMYEINRATQAELNRIRNDDALSNDEKVEALAQTQVQQQQALEQIVGPEAFQRWLQTQGRAR